MAVLPLLLGREKNAVSLSAPLLLREMNTGRGCGMKFRTVTLVFIAPPLSCIPTLSCQNLACKLTEQAKDDCPRIVDMDWTYRDKNRQRMHSKFLTIHKSGITTTQLLTVMKLPLLHFFIFLMTRSESSISNESLHFTHQYPNWLLKVMVTAALL